MFIYLCSQGFNKQAEYIAAMGPIGTNEHFANPNSNSPVNTVPDFLQMIIEQNVKLVVMMTLPRELKSGRIQVAFCVTTKLLN